MAKKRKRVRPADVIDGRVKPGPRALVSMIAEVNPTGRGLRALEEQRRYAEKSALQSLLLRWYGDAFFAEPTEVDDIVLLKHRHFDECACHAQVSNLDDDARAWVWRNLGDDPESEERGREKETRAPASDEAPRNPAVLLAEAQAALTAYDYERAERLLVGAFETTAGSAPASRALLELYVDVLGQDARALELEARLSRAARNDPPVRSLIGLAAARSGDATRAIALVRDLAHPRAGEVYATAGRGALRSGELDEARAYAAQARSLGAAPEAASLEAAIEKALRERAEGEEAKLEALIAAGDDEGAEAFARELLSAGFPSARAKRLLRDAAERRANTAEAELSKDARDAIEAGEWTAARRALGELARMGRADAALEAALEEGERAAEEAREAALVLEVLEALARAPEEGLARYLAEAEALRARVRAEDPTARCERAEAIRSVLKRPRSEQVARAVLHVEALERALDANDLDQAIEHAELLPRDVESLPDVRPLIERTIGMLGRRDAHEAKAHIDAAVAALNELRWERVLEEVRAIPALHLSYMREGAEVVRWLAQTAEKGREFEAQAARACEPDADLEALHEGHTALLALRKYVLDSHGADGAPEMPERVRERLREWQETIETLDRAKTAALRFVEHPVPEGTRADIEDEAELGAHAPDVRIDEEANIWLIASPEERCYLTEASLPDLIVKRRFSFTVPGRRRARTVIPVGPRLWIPLSDGGMLVLDRRTPSRVRDVWWGTGSATNALCETWAEIAADASAMVLRTEKKNEIELTLRAYPSGATRPLPRCATACFFGRGDRGRVLVTGGKRRAWQVYDTAALRPVGGAERFTGELADFLPIAAIDLAPIDDDVEEEPTRELGHVFLALDPKTMDGGEENAPTAAAFYLVRVSDDLTPVRHALVHHSCTGLLGWLFRTGGELLVVSYDGGAPRVDMFDPWSLESQGSIRIWPGLQVPVTNATGDITVLLERDHLFLHIPEIPAGAILDSDTADSMPFVSGLLSPRSMCAHSPDEWARPLFQHQCDAWTLKSVSSPFRRNALVAASANTARTIDAMHDHLMRTTPNTLLQVYWQEPDDTVEEGVFLEGAQHAVSLCPDDPKLMEWLDLALERSEDSHTKTHLLHLKGLASLALGRREDAVASWLRGAAIEGGLCPLRFVIAIMGGLTRKEVERHFSDLDLPAFVWSQAERYERAVVAMARLDEAIVRGRGEDAWREARQVRVLVGPSWQLSARVALLRLDHPRADTDPWRYQLDLSWMASHAWLRSTRNHMIFAGHHWNHYRFTEIATRAGQLLDAMGIGVAKRATDATC